MLVIVGVETENHVLPLNGTPRSRCAKAGRKVWTGCSLSPRLRVLKVAVESVLGLLFCWASVSKIIAPHSAAALSKATIGLNTNAATFLVLSIAWAELLLGVLLISGLFPFLTKGTAIVLILVFSALLMFGFANGFHGACGCLGFKESVPVALGRNAGVLSLLTVAILCEPRSVPTKGEVK